jgi:hypothetical protein
MHNSIGERRRAGFVRKNRGPMRVPRTGNHCQNNAAGDARAFEIVPRG